MPGVLLPADDLYARLEVDVNASPEAIEVAWRALLKRHHPDRLVEYRDRLQAVFREIDPVLVNLASELRELG